jgi:hypothetical protein
MRAFFLLAAFSLGAGLMMLVSPNGEECVYERVVKDNKLSGSYEVASGGDYDISASVFGPNEESHYKQVRQKAGSFQMCVAYAFEG